MHAMGIFVSNNAEALKGFADRQDQLAVLRRERPEGADGFFRKLMSLSFGIAGKVCGQTALEDVRYILQEDMPEDIQRHPFYASWLADMARVSSLFCDVEKSEAISFWIGSKRGCRRYHIDNVPRRLLVTYAGKGTEWLPDEAVDRRAYRRRAQRADRHGYVGAAIYRRVGRRHVPRRRRWTAAPHTG